MLELAHLQLGAEIVTVSPLVDRVFGGTPVRWFPFRKAGL